MKRLSYGDYGILERLRDGSPEYYMEGTTWTLLEEGYVIAVEKHLKITDAGRKYLKTYKKPDFPKGKVHKEPEILYIC